MLVETPLGLCVYSTITAWLFRTTNVVSWGQYKVTSQCKGIIYRRDRNRKVWFLKVSAFGNPPCCPSLLISGMASFSGWNCWTLRYLGRLPFLCRGEVIELGTLFLFIS
jgi:hypothetical protein